MYTVLAKLQNYKAVAVPFIVTSVPCLRLVLG